MEPSLPDLVADDDSDCDGDEDIQYVVIPADSAFYGRTSPPRSSAYSSFSGFPFACYALAEGTPLFAPTPGACFDEELHRIVNISGHGTDHAVNVVGESLEMDSHISLDWMSATLNDAQFFMEKVKPTPMIFDDDVSPHLNHDEIPSES